MYKGARKFLILLLSHLELAAPITSIFCGPYRQSSTSHSLNMIIGRSGSQDYPDTLFHTTETVISCFQAYIFVVNLASSHLYQNAFDMICD